MRLKSILAAFGVLVLVSSALAGEPPLWSVDPPHCSITFRIKHIFVRIPGRFARFVGEARFDPDNLAASSVNIRVDAGSIDTGVDKRDTHLRSPDFFETAKYPAITFASTQVVKQADGTYLAKGRLTIKDVTREVELPFSYLGVKESPIEKGKLVAGFESLFPVKLADYRVGEDKWQKMGVIGEAAEVAVFLELVREQGK